MPSGPLKHRVSLCLFFAVLLLRAARADVVVGEAAVTYGTVVSATPTQLNLKIGCAGSTTTVMNWDDVRSIVFDGECREHDVSPPTAGLLPCEQERVNLFKVYPSAGEGAIYGDGFQLQGGIVRVILRNNKGILTGPKQAVSALARVRACPTEVSEVAATPAPFCTEPVQFAVNWSLAPAMPNTVFTRGFAVFVETHPAHAQAPPLDVRGGLGTALTVWTSGLVKYKDKLAPTIGAYLQTTVSRSDRFMLVTPPQVIEVKCKENASMIVRVSTARGGDFSLADKGYLAKSQIEGRTVLLNAADHRFDYTLTRQVKAGDFDLIWVLAHELGHSFGLPDEYLGPATPSIMNPDSHPLEITERDAVALARSLERSVQGTNPGYFNATQCGGLRVAPSIGRAKRAKVK